MTTTLTQTEQLHYSRHFNLPEVGMHGQLKLKNARVLYIGAGGLGSAALLYLAAAGVGTIGIVDHDRVEISNLQRQILYSYDDINQQKTVIAKNKLLKLNPAITVITHDTMLSHDNALALVSDYDIIADGSDNFTTRYILNDACFHAKKPLVYASIAQLTGLCSTFIPDESACYRCLFDSPPPAGATPNCAEGGVLGVLPGILGSIQAAEIIKLIIGIGTPLTNRLLQFNASTMQFQEIVTHKNHRCRLCHHHEAYNTLPNHQPDYCAAPTPMKNEMSVEELFALQNTSAEFILLDVREPFEFDICHLNGILMPLNSLPSQCTTLDKNKHIIVYCKHGIRSRYAVEYLQQQGFKQVTNLTGGIIDWINRIDPGMCKY